MTDYYVKTDGDDNDDGLSWANAWASINKAATTPSGGDTVTFEDGTYSLGTGQTTWNSGSSGNRITFLAQNAGDVTWEVDGSATYGVQLSSDDYITFDGIVFDGDKDGSYTLYLLYLTGCGNVEFTDCDFVNCDGHTIGITGASSDITFTDCLVDPNHDVYGAREGVLVMGVSTDITFTRVEVTRTGHTGMCIETVNGLTIDDCDIHNTSSHCIEVDSYGEAGGTTNIVIKDSRIYDSGLHVSDDPDTWNKNGIRLNEDAGNVLIHNCDIHRHGLAGVFLSDKANGPIYIYNNTFHDCNKWDVAWVGDGYGYIHFYDEGEANPSLTVVDNIFYLTDNARTRLYHFTNSGLSMTADYNLLYADSAADERIRIGGSDYASFGAYQTAGYEPNSVIDDDPDFTDAGSYDFTLQASSPARGAGTDVGYGTDIGAHPYVASGQTIALDLLTGTLSAQMITVPGGILYRRVAGNNDDAISYPVEQFENDEGENYVGNDGGWNNTGLRFTNVTIPAGATINAAYVQLTASANLSADTVRTNIHYQDANNPGDFSGDNYASFEARSRSSTSVAWDFTTNWTTDSTYNTADISTVIQALVNEAYWASGEACVIFIDDDGSDTNAYRKAYAYDSDPSKAALLVVDYSLTQTVEINALGLTGAAQALTWSGIYTAALARLDATGAAQAFTVAGGAVSVAASALSSTAAAQSITWHGTYTTAMGALTLTGNAQSITWHGVYTAALNALDIAGTAQTVTIQPGAVAAAMDVLALTGGTLSLTIAIDSVYVFPGAIGLTAAPWSVGTSAGPVSVMPNALTLTGTSGTLAIAPGAVSVGVAPFALTSTPNPIIASGGAVARAMARLALTGTPETLTVMPGGITRALGLLRITGASPALVVVPGALTRTLDRLTLVAVPRALTVRPGTATTGLHTLQLRIVVLTLAHVLAPMAYTGGDLRSSPLFTPAPDWVGAQTPGMEGATILIPVIGDVEEVERE